MRKYLFYTAALISTPVLANSADCTRVIEEAKIQSSILRAPSAIAAVGSSSTSQQNAVIGVSYSFANRNQARYIDAAAQEQCRVEQLTETLVNWVKYNDLQADQVEARAANAYYTAHTADLTQSIAATRALVEVHQATILDLEEVLAAHDAVTTQIVANKQRLAITNRYEEIDVTNTITALRASALAVEREANKVRLASAWDLTVQVGGRQQVAALDRIYSTKPQAFATFSAKWSFGRGAAAAAASRANVAAAEAVMTQVDGPVRNAMDLVSSYKQQLTALEETQLVGLNTRIEGYERILNDIKSVDSVRAKIVSAQARVRLVHLRALREGVTARIRFLRATIAVFPNLD